MNWRTWAACRSEDPELFFPVSEEGASLMQTEQARNICRHCPVLHECRTWALRNREYEGVWGGLTAGQRRALSPARGTAFDH
ncbi:WhiB family transcriptional regulator [Streptomyces sp. NPDC001480]|uniref:WhiB family transcriptional regulator n=1 Tax=Streptomyces sp. NPDC001480 TaxID=3364577 RepID=UPI0036A28B6E